MPAMRANAFWLLQLTTAAVLALAAAAGPAFADQGVGVSLGRINIDDKLVGGGGYALPSLGVLNTGTEAGDYEVVVNYLQDQAQKRPGKGWFDFSPQEFHLAAGENQQVRIRMVLPTNIEPGDYYALIEAHSVAKGEGVQISAAAATQLSFTVKPSSWLQAQRVRINRWIDDSGPWSYVIPPAILAVAALVTLGRHFRLGVSLERRR